MDSRENISDNITLSAENESISSSLKRILEKSEQSICLPFELTITECHQIYIALRVVSGLNEIEMKHSKGDKFFNVRIASAFDIYDYIFNEVYELPITDCSLEHIATKSILYWDYDERFSLIAGSKEFCQRSFPYPSDVLEHYFVQSSISKFEDESELKKLFLRLHKNEKK